MTDSDTRPGLAELFLAFAKMSLAGFGGVLPWARRAVVDEHKWMTAEEFNEAFALAQFLPGANIVNFSVVFGSRIRGPLGGVVAFAGLLGPPVILVLILGILYSIYGELIWLQRILAGVAAAAAGLIIAVVARMAEPVFRRAALGFAPIVAVAVFVAVGLLRWPLPWVLAVAAPISVALAFWSKRGSAHGR